MMRSRAWGVGNGFNISRGFASWANEVREYQVLLLPGQDSYVS